MFPERPTPGREPRSPSFAFNSLNPISPRRPRFATPNSVSALRDMAQGALASIARRAVAGAFPTPAQTIFEVIRDISARGTTILLIEQNARQALAVAARGYVLEVGRIAHAGAAAELAASESVRAAYLGGAA